MNKKSKSILFVVVRIFIITLLFNFCEKNKTTTINILKNQNFIITQADKSLILFINSVSDSDFANLKKIFSNVNLKELLFEVSSELKRDSINFNLSNSISSHGAFDPNRNIPTFILNSSTGVSSSNIAHELIHAIQINQGYPTVKIIYDDKRNDVLRELSSNLLHIPLTNKLEARGFSIEEYLSPTLLKTREVLTLRGKFDETGMIFYRAHYEAAFYLRLHYEAKYLNNTDKNFYINLYEEKAPIAFSIAKKLIAIISKYNLESPSQFTKALYECITLLNNEDLSNYYNNYIPNCYSEYLTYMKYKYEYLR